MAKRPSILPNYRQGRSELMTTYTKDSNEWLLIRAKTGYWFSRDTLAWHGSRIYWNTLTKVEDGWLFITQEDNFDKTKKLFSIRKVFIHRSLDNTDNYGIETITWQEHADLASAKSKLAEILKEGN